MATSSATATTSSSNSMVSANTATTPTYHPPTPAKLSLGCSAFGGVFTPMSDNLCLSIIKAAFSAGITWFDTAPWYLTSESVLGRCFQRIQQEHPRQSYVLNTKCGRYPSGPKMFDFSAAKTEASVAESLLRLQTDYLDMVQVHDCEFGDEEVILSETLPMLARLRSEGKIRRIGITSYEISTVRRIIERTDIKIDSVLVYCRYSLNDRSLTAAAKDQQNFLSFLEQKQIAFVYASPIAMGLLCNRAPPAWHPASAALKQRVIAANAYAEEQGCNLARLAIGFTLQNQQIPTTLVSCTSLELMQANIDVMQQGLTEKENAVLQHILSTYFPQSEHWEGVEKAKMVAKAKRKQQEAAAKAAQVSQKLDQLTLESKTDTAATATTVSTSEEKGE